MDNKDIATILHEAGLKFTTGRAALLELLRDFGRPLTQEEISDRLTDLNFNRVSIYRALASFLETGIVHRIDSGDRVWKFAYCNCGRHHEHRHPHFICRSCGKVECLQGVKLPRYIGPTNGYLIEEQEFYLRGLCPKCSS